MLNNMPLGQLFSRILQVLLKPSLQFKSLKYLLKQQLTVSEGTVLSANGHLVMKIVNSYL